MQLIVSLFVGLIFALGLGLSGMTQPEKVIGFLDFFGEWNPALAFVMIGAILTHAPLFFLVTKRKSPILADQFQVPKKSDLTTSLILGAAFFGMGWGIAGFCPGPAITSLASLEIRSFFFVIFMLIGMLCFKLTKPYLFKYLS